MGATGSDPLACVLYAVEQLLPIFGQRVAVLGLGPIGLLFARIPADRGASWVTGVDTVDRSAVARLFGIDLVSGITHDRRRMLDEAGRYLRDRPELPSAFVTNVVDVRGAQRAFELAARPAPGRLKVVLRHGAGSPA